MKMSELFPNGASSKDREALRDSLFEKYGNPYLADLKPGQVPKDLWPKEAWIIDSEISALSMLDSCFAYGSTRSFYEDHPAWSCFGAGSHYDHYLAYFLEEGGDKEEFDRMIDIQIKYLNDKCRVLHGVGVDGEGCIYSSIVEPDSVA